mmetsp:Transcript_28753/g.60444  ORF Transcript_28753/g.60444 Transcript_28753/m.60444 type:complete len:307 (-) Transcript_28753:197-1117(-)
MLACALYAAIGFSRTLLQDAPTLRHTSAAAWRQSDLQALEENRPSPLLPLLPLPKNEILEKLDGVPVFAVQSIDGRVVKTEGPDGQLSHCFYLDVDEALAALRQMLLDTPRARVQLGTMSLGAVFSLSEWRWAGSSGSAATPLSRRGVAELLQSLGSGGEEDTGAVAKHVALETPPPVRIQGCQAELQASASALASSPAPDLVLRRNARMGAIPLFGCDELRLAVAQPDGQVVAARPLFFTRADLRKAWRALEGTAPLTGIRVTDLRTITWQMQADFSFDWQTVLFVAAESSVAFANEVGEADLRS